MMFICMVLSIHSFEETLRRVDPSVSLAYWDNTLDHVVSNPVNSIIWKPEFLGNSVGAVISGPATDWVTHQGRLQRDYGKFSRLMSKEDLRHVLTKCRLEVRSFPLLGLSYAYFLQCGLFAFIKGIFIRE